MKNLYVITLVFCVMLLQNCTPEDSLTVGLALASPSNDASGSANISAASEWSALYKNWSNNSCNNFNVPMEHGDNIIFLDNNLISVNKYTGIENWNLDIGHCTSAIQPIIADDKMYFIDNNIIFIIGLDTGELLLKYQWKYTELITRQFNIRDGIMYVNLMECNYRYSAFASCPLTKINRGEWTYLNRNDTNDNLFLDMTGFKVGVNSTGQHIIYFTGEIKDITDFSISSNNSKVKAYNVSTKTIIWEYNGSSISFINNEILLTDLNQVIVNDSDFMYSIDSRTGQKKYMISTSEHSNSFSQTIKMIQHKDMLIYINGKEIATAYNINSGAKLWELRDPKTAYSYIEKGAKTNSINLLGDKLIYLSDWGYLLEVDLVDGTYIKHHESLELSGGLIVDEDENFITYPMYGSSGLLSFSL